MTDIEEIEVEEDLVALCDQAITDLHKKAIGEYVKLDDLNDRLLDLRSDLSSSSAN